MRDIGDLAALPGLRPGIEPRDYQAADAVDYLARLDRGDTSIFSHHEQGLGKSLIALMVYLGFRPKLRNARLLILGPSVARASGATELDRWAPAVAASTLVLEKGADVAKLIKRGYECVVCSYDMVRQPKVRSALRAWAAGGFAILDEYQYLRTSTAKRTEATYSTGRRPGSEPGVLADIDRALLMSGTPVVSWPKDMWSPVSRWQPGRLIDEEGDFMSEDTFLNRYHVLRAMPVPYAREPVMKIVAVKDQENLRARLTGMAIRRTKDEVNLPPLIWQTMPIQLTAKAEAEMARALLEAMPEHLHAQMRYVTKNPGDIEAAEKLAAKLEAYQSLIPVMGRILGMAKVSQLGSVILDELNNSDYKIGIGCWNRQVMDVLQGILGAVGVVRIDGATSDRARKEAVTSFMSPQGARAFIGQLQACSTALTLTSASRVIMPQMSWTPGDNLQFASRFHRIGQRNTVVVRVPVAIGTLDEALQRVNIRKTNAASYLIEDEV